LRKLGEGDFDALILALAGLERLGRVAEGEALGALVPAAGQGALALEARTGTALPADLNDPDTATCVAAERELVHALGATCDTPIGAHAHRLEDGRIELHVWLGLPDGSVWLEDRLIGRSGVGADVAERMLAAGAGAPPA